METIGKINAAAAKEIYDVLVLEDAAEFRLLTLRPAASPSPTSSPTIECTMGVASLADPPAYTALSYVWGKLLLDGDQNFPTISLCNRPYAVTKNLHAALTRLRSPDGAVRLWIDALCINQCSPAERSAQVGLMHRIFAGARRVVAWLGEADDLKPLRLPAGSTAFLFDTIRQAKVNDFNPAWMRAMLLREEEERPLWESIAGILFREFWRRVWITQEIAGNANKVMLTIGSESVAMESCVEFLRSLFFVATTPRHERLRTVAMHALTKTFVHLQVTGGAEPWLNSPSLMARVVLLTNMKLATDQRDLLFGIRSLLPEAMRACISVDYTKSVGDVFADATGKLIALEGAMDGLLWRRKDWDHRETCQDDDIPTWAVSVIGESSMPISECALGSKFRASGEFPCFHRIVEGRELEVRGFKVGVVRDIRVGNLTRDADLAFRFSAVVAQAREWFGETKWPCDPDDVDRQTYAMTVLSGGWSWMAGKVEDAVFRELPQLEDLEDRRAGEALQPLGGRELFVFEPTEVGRLEDKDHQPAGFRYMGLASNERVFPGDIICALLGFKTPVILEPVGDKYYLVGDAYIRIYMDGEAMGGYTGDVDELDRFFIK